MDIISGLVVFFLTWWIVIFMVLPWGLKRDEQGKPENPQLKKKAIITTIITTLIWIVFDQLVRSDLISFREMALNLS